MQTPRFITSSVGAVGAGSNPATLAQASTNMMRVVVRNAGGNLIFLAHDITVLNGSDGPTGASFRLPAGAETVFVLEPSQRLMALGAGVGGLVSIATSDALPVDVVAPNAAR